MGRLTHNVAVGRVSGLSSAASMVALAVTLWSAALAPTAARAQGMPLDRIVFEVTEGERVEDGPWFAEILREYQRCGFLTAIDDFGAGYAGLRLLADFQPDILKIDMDLVRHIHLLRPRQAIVRHIARLAEALKVAVVAEGIETADERDCLVDLGVVLHQGWLYARPGFQALPPVDPTAWPAMAR